jgi:hypothetical protein
MFGDSSGAAGVWGRTATNHGVFGQATGNGNGVFAQTASGNGLVAQATGGGNAAQFLGNVIVQGNFTVAPGFAKSVAVVFPDGSLRRMYCVESPENWFEDFGGGSLSAGRAVVALDADFATTVQPDSYHVFLTAQGPSNGLYVSTKSATGFTVQEQGSGTSNVAFSYRVVGKRKDATGTRLERIAPLPTPPTSPAPPTMPIPAGAAVSDARPGAPGPVPLTPAPVQPPNRAPRR